MSAPASIAPWTELAAGEDSAFVRLWRGFATARVAIAAVLLALLLVALLFDRQLSVWARSWPAPVLGALESVTRYGESDWILVPAAALYLLTALVTWFVRWKLMRTLLWQFAALYAFIFAGVGLPGLFATLLKRLIGRGRPDHFDAYGVWSSSPNWLDWTFQSFPSGHATTSFALAAVLGFVSPRWFYPTLGFAAVVAVSRVAVGAHYPSDVLAGAIVGLLGACVVRLLFASRRWMFEPAPDGNIRTRPMSSLRRYLALKRRGSGPAQQPDRT